MSMTRFSSLIVFLLGANLLLTLALLIATLTSALPVESVTALGPIFVLGGIVVALFTLFTNLQRASSDDLLNTATDLLEKAYQTLKKGDHGDWPSNDRHSWLMAARMISTAEQLSTQLTQESHHVIYSKTKEYWRANLYDLVFPSIEGLPRNFYAEQADHMDGWTGAIREPLSEKSLAFIYRFIQWPDGIHDPIQDVPVFGPEEVERMRSFGPRELGGLFYEVHRLRDKRQASTSNG
jgi:hypothetical protein